MNWRPKSSFVLLGMVVAGWLTGCAAEGPAAATVSGEIKLNGVPLERGAITFASADGPGQPVTAEIKDGHYTATTTAGNKKVYFSAPVVVSRKKESSAPNAPVVEITAEGLPERFNAKSEFTLDVQPGSNNKDWDLHGTGKKH